jgi:hypothetical protein
VPSVDRLLQSITSFGDVRGKRADQISYARRDEAVTSSRRLVALGRSSVRDLLVMERF